MTTSTVTDEAVEAVAHKLWARDHASLWELGPLHELLAYREAGREALEAAVPLLTPQPVVDREALVQLVAYCRDREVYKGRDNEIGADTAYGDVADRLDAVLALLNGTAK